MRSKQIFVKSFNILLQLVILAAMTCLPQMASADTYECATWDELISAFNDHGNDASAVIKLTSDIDLDWEQVDGYTAQKFKAQFDGQNHIIRFGKIRNGLIAFSDGASIKNLTFENIKAVVNPGNYLSKQVSAILVLFAENTVFENIVFKNCTSSIKVKNFGDVDEVSLLGGSIAKGSTVRNCTAQDCTLYSDGYTNVGVFTGYARDCNFEQCHAIDCSVEEQNENRAPTGTLGGYIAASHISNCSASGDIFCKSYPCGGLFGEVHDGDIDHCTNEVQVIGYEDNVGGIVGKFVGRNNTISYCVNKKLVGAKGSQVNYGGIVGILDGNVKNCLNTAKIYNRKDCIVGYSAENMGGIVGYMEHGSITGCVNTGEVQGDTDVGGIVGHMLNSSKLFFCLSTGKIYCDNDWNMCIGEADDGCVYENYYWQADEVVDTQTFDYGKMAIGPATMRSGMVAYMANELAKEKGYDIQWGQKMSNNGTYIDACPTPEAPTVFKHEVESNCMHDNVSVYYNNIQSPHYGEIVIEDGAICNYCEQAVDYNDDENTYYIYNAEDLYNFAVKVVPKHQHANAVLEADIDCSSLSTCAPIGSNISPYQGVFNGQNHRIKNFRLNTSYDCAGLFRRVSNGAVIKNVIIDESCAFVCTINRASAGLVGCVGTTTGEVCAVEIINCGNEADVIGKSNAAGILGGVYNNEYSSVIIKNCYNTGNITGEKESAAICGWANKNYYVENCWNTGTVSGYDDGMYFLRYNTGGKATFSNNFSSTGTQTGVTSFCDDDIVSGKLCWMMNGSVDGATTSGWYQNLDNGKDDTQPTWIEQSAGVYQHYVKEYCDDEEASYFYNNQAETPALKHAYDANGICTRKAGETHYEPAELYNDNYLIRNAGNMYWVANSINAGETQYDCVLSNDITFNDDLYADGTLATDLSDMQIWTPIGTITNPFDKVFDGKGHTISGLYSTVSGDEKATIGLIGVAGDKAVIKNVGVVDCYINNSSTAGETFAGAILGYGQGSSILNCYSAGEVHGTIFTGGIAGLIQTNASNFDSNLVNVFSACKIEGTQSEYTGALFGALMKEDNIYTGTLNGTVFYQASNTTGTAEYGTALTANEFKMGKVAQLLNKVSVVGFTLEYPWKQNIGTNEYPVMGNRGIYNKRQVSSAYHWGTVIVPFTLTSNDDIEYYIPSNMGTEDDANLTLKKVETVEPNTPCFFNIYVYQDAAETDTHGLTFTNSNDDWTMPDDMQVTNTIALTSGNSIDLIGTYENVSPSITTTSNKFYLANDKIWRGDVAFNVPAFRAYINASKSCSAKSLTLCIGEDDNETAIGEITTDGKVTFYEGPAYNLAGQRVGKNAKGIIVCKGKKTIKK